MEVSGRRASVPDNVDQSPFADQYHTVCQPCSEDGRRQNAHGYCNDCEEYLCEDCRKYHRNLKATRNHVLVDMADMPQGDEPSSDASNTLDDKLTDTCSEHADEIIKYHCKTDNKTACTVCVTLYHRHCSDVRYIPNITNGIADSQLCHDLLQELTTLTARLNNMEFQARESIEAVEKASDEYSQQIQKYRNQLVAIVDKLAAEAEDKKKTYIDQRRDQLNNIRKHSQDQRRNIEAVTSQINDRRLAVQENRLFLSLKQAETLTTDCRNYNTSAKHNVFVCPFEFRNNSKLHGVLSNVSSLGYPVTGIQMYGEINVQTASEGKNCDISAVHILSDGRLIVADGNDSSVKLFDSNYRLESRVKLPSEPTDIAVVSTGEVALALPGNNTIQFLLISDSLNLGKIINTGIECWSLAVHGDMLISSGSWASVGIVKLDMNGRELGNLPGYLPQCVRIHPDNSNIYESHHAKVKCLTLQGDVLGEYWDSELQDAQGIAIHPDGSVYVCGRNSNNIHHITADCEKIDIILTQGEIKKPRTLCFDCEGKILYVGEDCNNKLKVFRLFL